MGPTTASNASPPRASSPKPRMFCFDSTPDKWPNATDSKRREPAALPFPDVFAPLDQLARHSPRPEHIGLNRRPEFMPTKTHRMVVNRTPSANSKVCRSRRWSRRANQNEWSSNNIRIPRSPSSAHRETALPTQRRTVAQLPRPTHGQTSAQNHRTFEKMSNLRTSPAIGNSLPDTRKINTRPNPLIKPSQFNAPEAATKSPPPETRDSELADSELAPITRDSELAPDKKFHRDDCNSSTRRLNRPEIENSVTPTTPASNSAPRWSSS